MSRQGFECLGKTLLLFSLIFVTKKQKNVATFFLPSIFHSYHNNAFLCHDIILALLQELLRQCRDIKIHCRNIVLSSDFHYVTIFISLLQHFSINPSHIMSRRSFEMSQQSLNFQLEFNFVFVTIYHCLLRHCPVDCLELLLQHSEIMSLHFCLSQFFANFLAGFVSFTFKTCKTQSC